MKWRSYWLLNTYNTCFWNLFATCAWLIPILMLEYFTSHCMEFKILRNSKEIRAFGSASGSRCGPRIAFLNHFSLAETFLKNFSLAEDTKEMRRIPAPGRLSFPMWYSRDCSLWTNIGDDQCAMSERLVWIIRPTEIPKHSLYAL